MKLSKRLQQILYCIPTSASRVADIGSDHAFVPIALISSGAADFAIASEVAAGPLNSSRAHIASYHLGHRIETRLGDGLGAITLADEIDTFIIAGMGGELIERLLTDANPDLLKSATLVLEPNNQEKLVRRWLSDHHFRIHQEVIVAEDGHFYEIMVADQAMTAAKLSELDCIFGPCLRVAQSPVFQNKWTHRLSVESKVLWQLQKASVLPQAKIEKTKAMIQSIEKVLSSHDSSQTTDFKN